MVNSSTPSSHYPPTWHNQADQKPAIAEADVACALCELPIARPVTATINEQHLSFCCHGCRHIYEIVAPDLANGTDLLQAMGHAGLDLNAPCCRGIIKGDPQEEADRTLSRLMLNAFLAMMVMVLSLALYSDFFFAEWGEAGQNVRGILQVMMMVFATPAVLLLALPILEDAIFTFQIYRQLTTSALIAIGTLAAYGVSVYATFIGQGHTYFETVTMTLLLVTLGRWLDAKAQANGNQALDELLARIPAEANLVVSFDETDSQDVRVPVDTLNVGDHIRVRPGENFAIDGQIISGEGSVNEANITGEFTPVYKGPDHVVYGATSNIDGSFLVKVTHTGEARVMSKLIRLLDEARLHRAPIEQLADKISGYFVPIVVTLAFMTFVYWSWYATVGQGLLTALAVLLIACPCALGIATPLAIWSALGQAAQAGVLIRDSLTLEKLAHIRHIFFDKTGTLTTGQPDLVEIVANPPQREAKQTGTSTNDLLQLAASVEYHSEHPLAISIITAEIGRAHV